MHEKWMSLASHITPIGAISLPQFNLDQNKWLSVNYTNLARLAKLKPPYFFRNSNYLSSKSKQKVFLRKIIKNLVFLFKFFATANRLRLSVEFLILKFTSNVKTKIEVRGGFRGEGAGGIGERLFPQGFDPLPHQRLPFCTF